MYTSTYVTLRTSLASRMQQECSCSVAMLYLTVVLPLSLMRLAMASPYSTTFLIVNVVYGE